MSQVQLLVYGSTQGVQVGDTAASANTAVVRDGSGNILGAQVAGSEVKTTGLMTLAVKATQTTSQTLDDSAVVWPFDTTSGSLVPTLPPVATCAGRLYIIIKIVSGNTLTITGNGSENINASNTKALTTQWSVAAVVSNGTNWNIIASI